MSIESINSASQVSFSSTKNVTEAKKEVTSEQKGDKKKLTLALAGLAVAGMATICHVLNGRADKASDDVKIAQKAGVKLQDLFDSDTFVGQKCQSFFESFKKFGYFDDEGRAPKIEDLLKDLTEVKAEDIPGRGKIISGKMSNGATRYVCLFGSRIIINEFEQGAANNEYLKTIQFIDQKLKYFSASEYFHPENGRYGEKYSASLDFNGVWKCSSR
ncbi:MAG: hypothetical protein IJB79_01050 [Candidatus Gastranaerophilales bacterium]|nr:hypothetical protein [Candidatus Gastranaerophilales bacterium]